MNGNELAFPFVESGGPESVNFELTKREYFAGIALQGLLSRTGNFSKDQKDKVAQQAVGYADALLEQLGNEGSGI